MKSRAKFLRAAFGFSLTEVMIGMAVLSVVAIGVGQWTVSMRAQTKTLSSKSSCAQVAANIRENIWAANSNLVVRDFMPAKYNDPDPYTSADAKDPLYSGSGRAHLKDSVKLFSLDANDFVQYENNRFKVATYQNIRNSTTWAVNLYNSCGPSPSSCPFTGNIADGVDFTGPDYSALYNTLPNVGGAPQIPASVSKVTLMVAPDGSPTKIGETWTGDIAVNIKVYQDTKVCGQETFNLKVGAGDSDAPVLAKLPNAPSAITLSSLRKSMGGSVLLANNPKPTLVNSFAYSAATNPEAGTVDDFASAGIPLEENLLDGAASPMFCTCAQADYRDWNGDGVRNCPHWSRTVYLEATSSESGTLLFCQRTTLPATSTDAVDSTTEGDLTKYRYCALDLYDKEDSRNNSPCLIQLPTQAGSLRACQPDSINKKSRINLTWNDLPDGDYKINFRDVDAFGNASKVDYPITFHVGNPTPNFSSCPSADSICPTDPSRPKAPADATCGYTFSCPASKATCPDSALYCADNSPCYLTGTCPAPYQNKPTPACPDKTVCPSGTRALQGCPVDGSGNPTTYTSCAPRKDDCGNLDCPGWALPTPPPSSVLATMAQDQYVDVCGTKYYGTGCIGANCNCTGCPDPSLVCSGEKKDNCGRDCPGNKTAVCPPDNDYCGTQTITCGTTSKSCTSSNPCATPTPDPSCAVTDIWGYGAKCSPGEHAAHGGASYIDLTDANGHEACGADGSTDTVQTSRFGDDLSRYNITEAYSVGVYGGTWHSSTFIDVNGSRQNQSDCGAPFCNRQDFDPNSIIGATIHGGATYVQSWHGGPDHWQWDGCASDDHATCPPQQNDPSPYAGGEFWVCGWPKSCAAPAPSNSSRCSSVAGGGGGGGGGSVCAPGNCPRSVTDQTCAGQRGPDTCGNPGACIGTGPCNCQPWCPSAVTNTKCAGQIVRDDGCGGYCYGTAACTCGCDPATTNNYCIGQPAPDTCGLWPGATGSGNCTGTQPPGCPGGTPICGGTCPTPTPVPCMDECSEGAQSPNYCDMYYACSYQIYNCNRNPATGCTEWQAGGFCESCDPYYYYP